MERSTALRYHLPGQGLEPPGQQAHIVSSPSTCKSMIPGTDPQTAQVGKGTTRAPQGNPSPGDTGGGKAPTGAEPASQPKGRQRRQPKAAQGGRTRRGEQGQHQNKTETKNPKK